MLCLFLKKAHLRLLSLLSVLSLLSKKALKALKALKAQKALKALKAKKATLSRLFLKARKRMDPREGSFVLPSQKSGRFFNPGDYVACIPFKENEKGIQRTRRLVPFESEKSHTLRKCEERYYELDYTLLKINDYSTYNRW